MAKKQNPDLIILDVMMPDMDGAEVVKVLKSEPSVKDIPVIFLTALVLNEEESGGQSSIMVDGVYYTAISKPFKTDKFLETIKSNL